MPNRATPAGPGARRDLETHFSWCRTRMSVERTLMSWVRTGSALIGFGFTIVQFLEHVAAISGARPALLPSAPVALGLSLVGAGTIGLAIATWEYVAMTRYLWSGDFASVAGIRGMPRFSPTLAVAAVLALIGVVAFAMIAYRLTSAGG